VTNTVLVVDGPFEAGTDLVVEGLSAANVPVFRMDTHDFPSGLELNTRNLDGRWVGTLGDRHRTVELSDIKAVYWNRPRLFDFPELSESDAHWARGAARIGFGGVITSLDARWMNHPAKASAAEFKPSQLQAANSVGLRTPRTLITNRAEAVVQFAKDIDGPLITKPLGTPYITHSQGSESMYTRVVDLEDLQGVEVTAHLFQEQIPKDFEVRLIYVDNTCHSVRIDAGSDLSRIDWRSDYESLEYSVVRTPCSVAASVCSYMAAMGLTYAAFDFIVRDDVWTFLEANPSGQWAWMNSDEIPLASSIYRTLEDWCSR
jgi:ATP-grasp ribosomal peptide maturase